MKARGIESHEVEVDLDEMKVIDALLKDWMSIAVGSDIAYPMDGKWYRNYYAAHPDFGKPSKHDIIRKVTWGEDEIYHGLQNLHSFYQDKINKDYERNRAREEKWGLEEDDV